MSTLPHFPSPHCCVAAGCPELQYSKLVTARLCLRQAKGHVCCPGQHYYDLDGVGAWAFLGFSSLFFLAFFGVAYLALAFVRHQKR